MAAADGNTAGVCEYRGTLSLEAVVWANESSREAPAHDLFLNFEAGGNATYLLDYFWMRAGPG